MAVYQPQKRVTQKRVSVGFICDAGFVNVELDFGSGDHGTAVEMSVLSVELTTASVV
jgi:hypothetical protein